MALGAVTEGRGTDFITVAEVNDWQPPVAEGGGECGDPRRGVRIQAIPAGRDATLHLHLHVDDKQSVQREIPALIGPFGMGAPVEPA